MNAAFQIHIADPLSSIVGDTLTDAGYWIIAPDQDDFRADRPNASGLAAIKLRFGGCGLEITWNWEKQLREERTAYHIQVTCAQGRELAGLWDADALRLIPASDVTPWAGAVGEALQSVRVLGLDGSPQAIKFLFPGQTIVVTTGYSGDDLSVGDGDELLILSGGEWETLTEDEAPRWQLLWSSSTPVRPAFAVKG